MKLYKNFLTESKKQKVVFVFGRMNPPTVGHSKVIDTIKSVAKRNNADYSIFLSQSHDSSKNPLDPKTKQKFFDKMFRDKLIDSIRNTPVKTPLEAAVQLYKKGYKDIIFVGGSDRKSMADLLKRYNDKESSHGYYNFRSIEFVSAGERDPDSDDISGMSASKVREFVKSGDYKNFEKSVIGLNTTEKKELYNTLRKTMKLDILKETILKNKKKYFYESVNPVVDANRKYINYTTENFNAYPKINVLFEEIDSLHLNEQKNLYLFEESVKNVDKALSYIKENSIKENYNEIITYLNNADNLLYDIESHYNTDRGFLFSRKSLNDLTTYVIECKNKQVEIKEKKTLRELCSYLQEKYNVKQDPDVKDKEGTQPAKYFKGLSKSTKEKRDAHFKKGKEKHWDDSSAYKPAPGDDVETKESKYTKAMKKKFPSLYKEENIKERSDSGLVRQAKDDAEISAYRKKTMQNDLETERAKIEKMKLDREKLATVRNNVKFQKGIKETLELDEGKADSSIAKKAEKSGISAGILRQVYNRGVAAWRTGHRPGTTPEQWGHARVNSFISGGKTRTTADADLWKKHKGNK